jgi:hypothetical protein
MVPLLQGDEQSHKCNYSLEDVNFIVPRVID